MAEKYLVRLGDQETSLEFRRENGRTYARREGAKDWRAVELERVGDSGLYLLMLDHHPVELYLARRRGGAVVTIGRHTFDYDVGPWRPPSQRAKAAPVVSGVVRVQAPMTGSIVEVRCEVGQKVAAGDVVMVIESMKMNNELRCPTTGTVEAIPVAPGQRVKAGDLVVALRA